MTGFASLLQQSTAQAWLFVPSAILLGALHGLEPGHSKTMMAAFIVAIRGTVGQAVLLALSATISHTAVVWVIALGGMYLGRSLDAETSEPYFQLASAVIIVAIALWMFRRTWRDRQRAADAEPDHRAHGHERDTRRIDTGHGTIVLELFAPGAPPRWRLRVERGARWNARDVALQTERPDGRRQTFRFVDRGAYLESIEAVPEPHQFTARLRLGHGTHMHDVEATFVENDQGHDPVHGELRGQDVYAGGYRDAHALAHANDIRRRFADRNVTTGQIVLFGLTGGLIPCPAAITVLLLCLQLKEITLGAGLVLCFSIGLAITLVAAGAAAALGLHHASRRWAGIGSFVQRAPYFSSGLIGIVGAWIAVQALIRIGDFT